MPMTTDQLQKAYPFIEEGPFRSHNELTAAIASPRYGDDPAYREAVAAKLAQTDRRDWALADTREAILHTRHSITVATDGVEW